LYFYLLYFFTSPLLFCLYCSCVNIPYLLLYSTICLFTLSSHYKYLLTLICWKNIFATILHCHMILFLIHSFTVGPFCLADTINCHTVSTRTIFFCMFLSHTCSHLLCCCAYSCAIVSFNPNLGGIRQKRPNFFHLKILNFFGK
jgi:hypothetical protein